MFDEKDIRVHPLSGEQFAHPQREGPVDLGKAQESAMSHVGIGDYGNIRTIEFVQPDGTIARLRTRGGHPVFETDTPTPVTSTARGFVAKVPAGRAVLFNPYTLEVLNNKYTPAGKNYTVQDFATTWGVPAGDTTHWHDVVLADGGVKINAKTYSPFGSFGTLSETAVPHIINRADDYDQYGNVELNLTQKRYFEVDRESVKTWGGAGSVSLLTPQAPITDAIRRAMTVGPRVDFPTDTAWLAEFYSSSVIWDDPGALWLYSTTSVQMLLTVPFLQATNESAGVDMPVPSFGEAVSSSGTGSESTTLPSTEIGLIGAGRVALAVPYEAVGSSGQYTVVYDWTGTQSQPLDGKIDFSYSRTQRQGSESATEIQAGIALTYAGSNEKHWDSRYETTHVKAQTVTVADHDPNGGSNSSGSNMTGDSDHLYWGQYYTYLNPPGGPLNTGDIASTRGRTTYVVQYNEYIPGSGATRNYENQSGRFTVSAVTGDLVSLTFSRNRSFGDKAVISPYTGYYSGSLADPIYDGPGFGSYNGPVYFSAYSDPATDITWIQNYNSYWDGSKWTQDASTVNEINTKYSEMAARFAAMTLYDNENSQGVWSRDHYTAYVANNVTLDDKTLNWDTSDYILHDLENDVFVSVDGHFAGTQSYLVNGTAALTVTVKIKTRHHTTVQVLEVLTFSYGSLLPEKQVLTGVRAVPSPQIRAIFTPLYREQGSFKGAHYVTAAEELAGALPFHGFNFRLRMTSYDAVGSVNTLNTGETVYLVPCNLLEMLYATVFSSEFGVADDGSRYPVTRPASYNAVMNSLFTNAYRVAVRDGVAGNWTDVFGSDFAETSTISLHRT